MKGKYALITGASSGMGESLTRGLAQKGVNLYLLARSEDKLKDLSQDLMTEFGVQARVFVCDLSRPKQVDQVVKKMINLGQPLDYVFSCAGYGVFKQAHQFSREEVEGLFQVNTLSAIHISQALLNQGLIRSGGHIFYIASMAGKVATPSSSVYSATKAALIKYADSLRLELKAKGIGVTTVNPGPVETPFFSHSDALQAYLNQVKKWSLTSDQVVSKILKVAQYQPNRREINLPYSLAVASILSGVFPSVSDKMILNLFNYK